MAGKVRIEASEYIFVNGHVPRGYGRWVFRADGTIEEFDGTYTECKRRAIQWAKKLGVQVIAVLG